MHVHTCLSPCGELDMHPAAVAQAAAEAGVDGLVVCDHNAADNIAATGRAARARRCAVVPGMEITTEEEVHVVALLPDVEAAGVLHARVAAALPGRNDPDAFGLQVVANEQAEVLGFNDSLLSGATTWSLDRTVDEIHRVGGLAIAAHVDRERFGLPGQLGFVPPGLALDALEVSCATSYSAARARFAGPIRLPLVTGSDAHDPRDVGRAITFLRLSQVSTGEIGQAFRDEHGRAVLGGGRPVEDLALHVLDIAQNSLEAGATRIEIAVDEDPAADRLTIEVRDNGRGMDDAARRRALDPFFTTRTTRSVGLGLALLRQAAEAAGGRLVVQSEPGEGTTVRSEFRLGHIDRAPLGDLETTVLVLAASHDDVDLHVLHRRGEEEYALSSSDVRAALGGRPLASPEGLGLLREAIRFGEAKLQREHTESTGGGRDD